MVNFIGKKVVARFDKAGVFFGTLIEETETSVILQNVRKLWYWEGACAVEQLAEDGVHPDFVEKCKFTVTVSNMKIYNQIQILLCTDKAIKSIEGVFEWKK